MTKLRCTREHMGVAVGTLGELDPTSADYLPGWDAGRFTVFPETFPEASPYGHRAVSYWTRNEMLDYWEEVRTC